MKHLRRLVLALVLLLSVVTVYAGGIKDAKDLVAFVTLANKGEDFSQFRNEACRKNGRTGRLHRRTAR